MKIIKKSSILSLIAVFSSVCVYALEGGPVQPDYLQFEPADMKDMVSMQTGDFAYSLPLGEIPGPFGSYPLSIAYHAGITPNQEATWVGLGWTLNPGSINRDIRGVPDDQFHGGTLGYIYQYASMSSWSVNTGWSYGVVSLGTTTTSNGGTGFSATIGPKLEGIAGVGFTVGTDGAGITAEIGKNGVGLNASLMFSAKDGTPTMSLGVSAGKGLEASAGVQYTPGQKVSANVGFGISNGTNARMGVSISPNGVTASAKVGAVSLKAGKNGASVSVGGASLSVSNTTGKGGDKTSTTGFGIIIPTYVGVFSFGFSQSLYEYWLRQATSEYVYGYMYQAGPAVVSDDVNEIAGMVEADGATQQASSKWKWNMKGRSLEYAGSDYMLPAYDVYSVASEGVSGSFRPFAAETHRMHKLISNKKINSTEESDAFQDFSFILDKNENDHWQETDEFADGENIYSAYKYYVKGLEHSPYSDKDTKFLNKGSRLVYRTRKENPDTTRSRMNFIFMGDGSGYFESENADEDNRAIGDKHLAPSKAFSRKLKNGDYHYALYGSKKVEPILEDNSPVGKIKGFVITTADGSKYIFEKSVKSYLKADYTINREKGVPSFVDKKGYEGKDFFKNLVEGLYEFGKWSLEMATIPGVLKYTKNFLFSQGSLKETCSADNKKDDDYFFSYQIQMNPHATQWLITEIQGPDFVELSKNGDMSENLGYNVKFNYTKPSLYRWRSPYARPNINFEDLPNYRLSRDGSTPKGCDSRMYQASFGLKEYVYLESIETATHKAEFNLNTEEEERVDGKGWETALSSKVQSQIPIVVQTNIKFKKTKEGTSFTYNGSNGVMNKLEPEYVYVNSKLPDQIIEKLNGKKIVVTGFDSKCPSKYYLHNPQVGSISACPNTSPSSITLIVSASENQSLFERTTGEENQYGLYRIPVVQSLTDEKPVVVFDEKSDELVIGESSDIKTYNQVIVLDWGEFIWSDINNDPFANTMRYLKSVSYKSKKEPQNVYRQFNFAYDYSLQPKTFNSYCRSKGTENYYPRDVEDINQSPNSAPEGVCAGSAENRNLYGKLTLKTITEIGCQGGRCASLPPFKFEYTSPEASPYRQSTLASYKSYSQGKNVPKNEDGDDEENDVYSDEYYENLTDVDATIVTGSNTIDDWGFWNEAATSENHKITPYYADYDGSAWSLQRITDPAGGTLDIAYERDVYQNGEDYSDERKFVDIYSFAKCESLDEVKNADRNVDGKYNGLTCIQLKPLYWREQCLGMRSAFWDKNMPVGFIGSGFEYLDSMKVENGSTIFFNIAANLVTKIKCGAFGLGRCSRTRTVGLFGEGVYVDLIEGSGMKALVLNRAWDEIEAGINRAGRKLSGDPSWRLEEQGRTGRIWAKQHYDYMKGGDLRVTKLIRHDIGRTQITEYEYAPGEMGQLPDSAFTTVLGTRFQSNKINYSLPDMNLVPKSRVVGINDDDLYFIPGSKISYPTVTVKNTVGDGNKKNGATEFKYITPETGIPSDYVDAKTASKLKPFVKLNLKLFAINKIISLIISDKDMNSAIEKLEREGFVFTFSLQDDNGDVIGKPISKRMYGSATNSLWFYDDDVRKAKKIVVDLNKTEELKDYPCETAVIDLSELKDYTLTDYNEISIGLLMSFFNENFDYETIRIDLNATPVWARSQKENFYPVLYKYVEYVGEDEVVEDRITYHDLSAFLGLNYVNTFYRGNGDNVVPIKKDSTLFFTTVPDVLSGVVDNDDGSVNEKIGHQVEHWNSEIDFYCHEDKKCKEEYPILFNEYSVKNKISESQESGNSSNVKETISKKFTYIRYPAFQIGSVSLTGFDNYKEDDSNRFTTTKLENHNFDPLTGNPSVTVATFNSNDGIMHKVTQVLPHYYVQDGDTSIADEMFRRNMLTQKFIERVYSATFVPNEKNKKYDEVLYDWKNLVDNQKYQRSASVSPYGFLDLSKLGSNKKPLMAYGTFSTKQEPSLDLYTLKNLKKHQNIENKPSLTEYNGEYITNVSTDYKVLETENVLGLKKSSHYTNDGMFMVGLFYPADYNQTCTIVPYMDGFDVTNCDVSGGSFKNAKEGLIADGSIQIKCNKCDENSVIEYRINEKGIWKTERIPYDSFVISSGSILNYLRIYPSNAEAKTFIYDNYGNMIQMVSETNTSTYYEFDSFGKLSQSRDDDGMTFKSHHREFMNDDRDEVEVTND